MTALTRACTDCRELAEDYEWEEGVYLCERHAIQHAVGGKCMCCPTVLERAEDAEGWYIDNGGQLCPTCQE